MKNRHMFGLVAAAIMLIPAYGCTPAAQRESGYVGDVTNPTPSGGVRTNRGNSNTSAYTFRPDLADHIRATVPGVRMASVFVRGNNAYVAVNNATTAPRTGNLDRVTPYGGTVTGGTAGGTITGGTAGRTGVGGTTGGTVTGGLTPGGATGVPSIDGRTGGYVGGTVGGTAGGTALTPAMKQRVTTEIRRVDPAITTVYVSDDPTLLARFRGLATGSLRSAADDFNNIIRQFFPTAR